MATVELSPQQIIDLVRQLSPPQKREALLALAGDGPKRSQRMKIAEEQLRRLASERKLNWDVLTEDEREAFIDDLLHEESR